MLGKGPLVQAAKAGARPRTRRVLDQTKRMVGSMAELEHEAPMVSTMTTSTVLDAHLLITYLFAGFFYVSRSNSALADAIRAALMLRYNGRVVG